MSLDIIAERYVRLTLQLAQHQPSLVEQWLGPADWRPGPRRPVAQLLVDITALLDGAHSLEPQGASAVRLMYLQQQIASLHVAARRLAGETMAFADEARAAFGPRAAEWLDAAHAAHDAATLDAARAELGRLLPGSAPLPQRYAAFRTAHAIAPERLSPTLDQAMEYCRTRVRTKMTLPDDEHVSLGKANGIGLGGQAVYETRLRSRVQIDTSSPLDLAHLVWLVAHESYPGHHVQHVLSDSDLVQARGWIERALYPSFGWHLVVAEGAAETGAALLLDGSQFVEACDALARTAGTAAGAVAPLVAVHRLVASLDLAIVSVAQRYLDHTLNGDAAVEALRAEAMVPDGRRLLSMIERQRTRILAYPVGRRVVSRHVFATASSRWERMAEVASTLVMST